MTDLPFIRQLYAYNRWANARTLEMAASLSQQQYTRLLGASHGSVQGTLTHIVWSEWVWLERWQGRSPTTVFAAPDYPTVARLRSRWAGVLEAQAVFLASLDGGRLQKSIRYVNLKGETWEYPLWQAMIHPVNHGTYHRGQVVVLIRQLGGQVAPLDFLVFYDEGGK